MAPRTQWKNGKGFKGDGSCGYSSSQGPDLFAAGLEAGKVLEAPKNYFPVTCSNVVPDT